jgi:hypothetical protein
VIAVGFALIAPCSAWAHDTKPVGPLRISFGWGDEPPFTGAKNFVEVEVADAAGRPIADPRGELRVEVSFGDQRLELPLLPDEEAGRFRAALIPTRPGTYAFGITGEVQGRAVDVGATCSDETFECVSDATEIQFPAKDPSASQLSDRLTRELPRAADRASDKATGARQLAIAALAVALLALAASIGFGLKNARKRG